MSGNLGKYYKNEIYVLSKDFKKMFNSQIMSLIRSWENTKLPQKIKGFTTPRETIGKDILGGGRAKNLDNSTLDFSTEDLAKLYCYFYMRMHLLSQKHIFTMLSKDKDISDSIKDSLFQSNSLTMIDIGCGPMTAGLAYIEFLGHPKNQDEKTQQIIKERELAIRVDEYLVYEGFSLDKNNFDNKTFNYIGIDIQECLIDQAKNFANTSYFNKINSSHINFFKCEPNWTFNQLDSLSILPNKIVSLLINMSYLFSNLSDQDSKNLAKNINNLITKYKPESIIIIAQNSSANDSSDSFIKSIDYPVEKIGDGHNEVCYSTFQQEKQTPVHFNVWSVDCIKKKKIKKKKNGVSTELTIKKLFPLRTNEIIDSKIVDIKNTSFVGVDFGTSNTVVSISTLDEVNGNIKTNSINIKQKLSDGAIYSSYKIPTTIAYYNNKLLVGEGAYQLKHKLEYGKNLWHSFKMDLGEDFGCKYPNSKLGENEKYTILNPKDATMIFFKYLKKQIENYIVKNNFPEDIKYAISIPASFEANQRRDLVDSLFNNGISIEKQSLIDEPNAAFLSYVSQKNLNNNAINIPKEYNPNVLVFDFGAGTCDISILSIYKDNNGVGSKNIAISKFDKIGGDDIDKLIVIDILLPQLFEGSDLKKDDFLTVELNELIIPKLLTYAERLKISICEKVSLQLESKNIQSLMKSKDLITLGDVINIDTNKGQLTLIEPKITISNFHKIILTFISEESSSETRIEDEVEFLSVYNPIKSALKKAKLSKGDIDYLLFIGGSSKNPFIQNSLSTFFIESIILLPQDLQSHVSAGAAIHSLIYNGFGKNIIQPITSEPIIVITTDELMEKPECLLSAGTIIPSDTFEINHLRPQYDGQEIIELPICIGSTNKILYNIKLNSNDSRGFLSSDTISLKGHVDSDKLLFIEASIGNKKINVEPLSPFANKELTTEDRMKLKAERDYNLACEKNGGEPSLKALNTLKNIYIQLKLDFKAAETLELISDMFPEAANYNNIGLHYRNAGKRDKAIKFYQKALDHSPSSITAMNMSLIYKHTDKKRYIEYLEMSHKINPQYEVTLFNLGKVYSENNNTKGDEFLKRSFKLWKDRFEKHDLREFEYSWFAACAEELGELDYAQHIIESTPRNNDLVNIYNEENLSSLV